MTLENAWKAAARAWWERLNEARGEARMWQQATAHACRSVELREKETEAFRAANHELSLARDKAENERDIANTQRDIAVEELKEALEERDEWRKEANSLRDARNQHNVHVGFYELNERIKEADRKHPRDLHDECVQPFARNALDNARFDLSNLLSWARVLKCEVAEAMYALAAESPERLADELLDVATVALRWRRAILERGE